MVSSITLDPYSIPKSLIFINTEKSKIAPPPRPTELQTSDSLAVCPELLPWRYVGSQHPRDPSMFEMPQPLRRARPAAPSVL